MESNQTAFVKTPLGIAQITGNSEGISGVSIVDCACEITTQIAPCLQECVQQLAEYFMGYRQVFKLKLLLNGTPFQQIVWNNLLTVPYGKTITYLEQAKQLGIEKSVRAVAAANAKNPLWIIIPCHRVIGSNGSLTGYAGGLWRKKWLLNHESNLKQETLF